MGNVHPYPLASQLLGRGDGGTAATKGIEDHVAGVAAYGDDSFQ